MIREMKKEDWPRVREIYSQALKKGVSTFNTACPSYEEWDRAHESSCRYVYLADGMVVGWVVLSPTSTRECFRGVAEVSIYLDDDYQGRGIGTALMERELSESEAAGFWCIYSAIYRSNEGSLALHRKCGFREIGYREKMARDCFGNWQDVIIMEKRSQKLV